MQRGHGFILKGEMTWRVDPNVDAAEKLPHWPRFHRACGERTLFFDRIERRDRLADYKCTAFTTEAARGGGWMSVFIAEGSGKSVLDALGDAFAKSAYDIPEAAALLAAGLDETDSADEFDALMDDDFEALL